MKLTEAEVKILRHAQKLNEYGIGKKCGYGEEIDLAENLVRRGLLIHGNDGRYLTGAGCAALESAS